MPSAGQRNHPHGLTLIELLVVIAIIAIVISLLLPALASARGSARTIKCLANMRSLETAHVAYYDDFKGQFIDANLAHGGVGNPLDSWPFVLSRQYGQNIVLRSPVDQSPFWHVDDGGQAEGVRLREYIDIMSDPARTSDLAASSVTRWTSYGLNNYTTRSVSPAPELLGRPGRYDAIHRIPSPSSTVHFLMMTDGQGRGDPSFARSDHVHAESWSDAGFDFAPQLADREMFTGAHGGKPGSPSAMANYGFLDGSASTLRFGQVYTDWEKNNFDPGVAN